MAVYYRHGSFEDEEKDITELVTEDAYRLTLQSVKKWVEENMDPDKTRIFFSSMSPTHEK